MRRLLVLGLLLTSACLPRGTTPAGETIGVGVLVQATTKRCTRVVTGTSTRRACLPRPRTARDTVPDSTQSAPTDKDAERR